MDFREQLSKLDGLDLSGLFNEDFLLTWDKSEDEIRGVLLRAAAGVLDCFDDVVGVGVVVEVGVVDDGDAGDAVGRGLHLRGLVARERARHRVAALVRELTERQQVAVLGLDTVFAEPDRTSPEQMLASATPAQRAVAHRLVVQRGHRKDLLGGRADDGIGHLEKSFH